MATMQQLQQKYPSAAYAFFGVSNLREAMDVFLSDTSKSPQFYVSPRLNWEYIRSYIDDLHATVNLANHEPDAVNFLNRRLKEAELLKQYLYMREKEVPATTDEVALYRQAMINLYGDFDVELFGSVLNFVCNLARQKGIELSDVCTDAVGGGALFQPTNITFQRYRGIAEKISPNIFSDTDAVDNTVKKTLMRALRECGLEDRGWVVSVARHGANILVAKHKKTVYVGPHFSPTSPLRMKQLIAHEIYGHARRSEFGTIDVSSWEEEGIAILLEQLVATRFMYKRMIRYLTICFAWGIDGNPRNFVDTYQVMLPIVKAITSYTGRQAEETCFRECVRAFRGGAPSNAGVVYTKDKIYFEANIALWRKLSDTLLSEDEFRAVLEKHATIFGEEQV
jgi:Domain of unknown function (DUF1704)